LIGNNGILAGIDISRKALSIAKAGILTSNVSFIEMDGENISFSIKFSKVMCQYGLMFFTNPTKSLISIRKHMTKNGKIFVAVHGNSHNVPYLSSIMKSNLKFIPDIIPKGLPSAHSLGDQGELTSLLDNAGFQNIAIEKYQFTYSPGTFDEYWDDYINCTADSVKDIIKNDMNVFLKIKDDARGNIRQSLHNGKIIFPWEILIASAENINICK